MKVRIVLILIGMFVYSSVGHACICRRFTPKKRFIEAHLIMVATVVKREPETVVLKIQHLYKGISEEVITTIAKELKSNVEAGTPLSFEQIKALLTDLGVDVSKLRPNLPPVHGRLIARSQPVRTSNIDPKSAGRSRA